MNTEPPNELPTIERIWSLYGERLRRYLASRTTNPADVDDLLQEVLLKTHQKLSSVRDLAELRSWLFRVATNTLVDHERRLSRAKESPLDEARPPAVPAPELPELSAAGQVELAGCVRVFMEVLESRDRDLLEAIDLGGQTQRQVADELALPYSTIKSRVQRARDRLGASLASCCVVDLASDGRVLGTPKPSSACGASCANTKP